jgi:hypothetical protein
MSFVKWAAAVTLAALVTMAGGVANANTVTIFNGASQKGTLSDLGGSIRCFSRLRLAETKQPSLEIRLVANFISHTPRLAPRLD